MNEYQPPQSFLGQVIATYYRYETRGSSGASCLTRQGESEALSI